MSEETPFKSMKITLSEEAINRLEKIMKRASFRSNSSTVEECVRVVYDIIYEIYSVCGGPDGELKASTKDQESEAFVRIVMRMSRFTGRVVCPPQEQKMEVK